MEVHVIEEAVSKQLFGRRVRCGVSRPWRLSEHLTRRTLETYVHITYHHHHCWKQIDWDQSGMCDTIG